MLFFLKLAAHQLWEQPKRFSAVGYEIALGWWVGSCWVREGISLGKQDVPTAYLCDWHWSCCAQPTLPRMGNPFLCLFPSAVKTRAARTKPLPTTRAGEKKKSTRKSSCWEFIVLSLTSFSIVCQMPDVKWVMHVSNTRHSHHVSTSWLFWKSSEQGHRKMTSWNEQPLESGRSMKNYLYSICNGSLFRFFSCTQFTVSFLPNIF